MGTWSGWENQFLMAAGIIVTPPNRTFMDQWSAHDGAQCRNAPVTLSTPVTGSTRCGDTVTPLGRTQNYDTHAHAAHAFKLQIDLASMRPLKAALNSGNPFQIGNRDPVVGALKTWGSPSFANWYKNATDQGTTGGSGSKGIAPDTLHGWHSLRRSLNRNWGRGLRSGDRSLNAALRSLSHSRKVHH